MSTHSDSRGLLELNDDAEMTFDRRTVGADRTPVLVIDNLFRFPQRVREFALFLRYDKPLPGDYWPGVQAAASLDRRQLDAFIKRHFVAAQCRIEADAFDFPVVRSGEVADQWSSFFLHSRFGLLTKTPEEAPGVDQPHVDEFGFVASVIYLSRPEQCRGGTVLCRHRETGIQTIPPFAANLPAPIVAMVQGTESFRLSRNLFAKECGHSSGESRIVTAAQHESILTRLTKSPSRARRYMTESTDQWELLDQIDMKFNRMVAYPTWQLHGVNWDPSANGPEKAEQRLTMMNWLNYPASPA